MHRFLTLVASYFLLAVSASQAQVVPDNSLPNNSVVDEELEVTGGTRAGNNLFHSFAEFSIETGETVFFNNATAVENIISRVTGERVSSIDGLLRANGTADLFLINPNGIIFGENAALDLGGSFISTTAESVRFADGAEFSAANPNATLLTVSIPVGLQYGSNPGDITVRGAGNNLTIDLDTLELDRENRPLGLQLSQGNTLALVGGNVFLPGGNLTVAEGRAVIGSVDRNSTVGLTSDSLGWVFDYAEVTDFQDINLFQAASIEASGAGGGEVRLQGKNVKLTDGSAILADTLGNRPGRTLEIIASEGIELTGFNADESFATRLSTDVDFDGSQLGGNLLIDTAQLTVTDGAQVTATTFGLGDAGNLQIVATDIEVIGESANGNFISGLFAQADFGDTGNGGNLDIKTGSLLIDKGAQVTATTFGLGDAGNLNIQANIVELNGFSELFNGGSGLFVSTVVEGSGGNLNLVTDVLSLTQGGQISTTTFGSGDSGNLNIKATNIKLAGEILDGDSSGIFAVADLDSLGSGGNINIETDNLSIAAGAQILSSTSGVGDAGTISIKSQQINLTETSIDGFASSISADTDFGTGAGGNIEIVTESVEVTAGAQITSGTLGSGDAGDLNIVATDFVLLRGASATGSSGLFAPALEGDGSGGNLSVQTPFLSILDGATITVSNFPSSDNSPFAPGTGAAGNLNVIADEIELEDSSSIAAETLAGDRGNVNLQTNLLLLRRGSRISTNALGSSTGGNITIDASDGLIVAIPDENSDITANAVFGAGGRVDIEALNVLGIEPRASLTPLSDITTSSEFGIAGTVDLETQDLNPVEDLNALPDAPNPPQLAQGCEVGKDNSGSFINIGQGGLSPQPDVALSANEIIGDVRLPAEWSENKNNVSIVEAENWVVNQEGKIELVAQKSHHSVLYHCQP